MRSPKTQHKSGKRGDQKFGRNKVSCAWYRQTHRREKNKVRRIEKHLKRHPNDLEAQEAIIRLVLLYK